MKGAHMRALILNAAGQDPSVGEFQEAQAEADQQIVTVLAAALNPVDRYMSTMAEPVLPRVVGVEGIGMLEDRNRVYFERPSTPYGSIAQQSVVYPENTIALPEQITNGAALALGVAGLAAWLPLGWKARLQSGETVLVLGATGVQGQIAVQVAKLLGAGRVIAAGRNREVLERLREHGADEITVLEGDMAHELKLAAPEGGYDVVIDSLFGEPFSQLLASDTLSANSRVVTLGGSAGQEVTLCFVSYSLRGALLLLAIAVSLYLTTLSMKRI
jgi:NADPH:quinone reductase-like Zn-dependent oxidoreductase